MTIGTERAGARWKPYKWRHGVERQQCRLCKFDTGDIGLMRQHADKYHPLGTDDVALEGIEFASLAAAELAAKDGLTAADFTGHPSSEGGYTTADVRRFTPPTEQEESDSP